AFDLKTQKPVAHVYERWGFTPLPPGQYRVSLLPVGYHALELPWGEVTVVAVRFPDVPERLARVMRVGRKTEKELDPVNYKKLEEEIEKAIRRGAAWL